MAKFINNDTKHLITIYVNLKQRQELTRTVQSTLDGTDYVEMYGKPRVYYDVTLYLNEEGKTRLEEAESKVSLCKIAVKKGEFTGRIVQVSKYDTLVTGWYKVNVTLAAVSEV